MNATLNRRIIGLILTLALIAGSSASQTIWHRYSGNPVMSDAYTCSVLYDTSLGQYRMWYTSFNWANSTLEISYATSTDGLAWVQYSQNPVMSVGGPGSFDSKWVTDPDVILDSGICRMYYTGFDGTYWRIGIATSSDGLQWIKSPTNPIVGLGPTAFDSIAASGPRVTRADSLYFMCYSGFDGSRHEVGLATSVDGLVWTKYAGNPVLTNGTPGQWDGISVQQIASTVVNGTMYLYYEGQTSGALGLATSADGYHWQKFSGNPVMAPGSASSWDHVFSLGSVLYDRGRFKLWYAGSMNGAGGWQLGYAYSDTTTDDGTVAYWHFDETMGNIVVDSSPYQNDGTAIGTTIVAGIQGNARAFNGTTDFIYVPNPSNSSLSFDSSQSFTIEAWFKSTAADTEVILRKGLAPNPGYHLRLIDGFVQGEVGDFFGGPPPHTVLRITSDRLFSDGSWHKAVLVRDRSVHQLFLYVDGAAATSPVTDNFPIPLASTSALNIGRYDALGGVDYFSGVLDEIRIWRGAHHPSHAASLLVNPRHVDFGLVRIAQSSSKDVTVTNGSFSDTLHVDTIEVSGAKFTSNLIPFVLNPLSSKAVTVTYTPTDATVDTGSIRFAVSEWGVSAVSVLLTGRAFTLGMAPIINTVTDIPDDQGKQVRVRWYPSIFDGTSDSLHATEYSVWRRVDELPSAQLSLIKEKAGQGVSFEGHQYRVLGGDLWDFITTVPAVKFSEYSLVAPTLYNSTPTQIRWAVFMIAAHMATGEFFFSQPDSGFSLDNIYPPIPTDLLGHLQGGGVALTWRGVSAPDLESYRIYRSTSSVIAPVFSYFVGTSTRPNYDDLTVTDGSTYHYVVTAVDSSGNESAQSALSAPILVTEVGNSGGGLPTHFALEQNYPNPFNPSTTIRYALPARSHVTLAVYNVVGQEVKRLVDETKEAGYYQFVWKADGSSGIYFIRLTAANSNTSSSSFVQTQKVLLLK